MISGWCCTRVPFQRVINGFCCTLKEAAGRLDEIQDYRKADEDTFY